VFRRRHDKMRYARKSPILLVLPNPYPTSRHEYMRHGKASNLCRKCNKTFLSKANLTKHHCNEVLVSSWA
jgi:hypothetical protein